MAKGQSTHKDISGKRFGRLVAVKPAGVRSGRTMYWLCLCDCGQASEVDGKALRRGETQSCGCFGKERRAAANTTHGQSKTPLNRLYRAMLRRCYSQRCSSYRHYGGRGITVCDRWRGPQGFANFAADMGPRPPGKSLERKDNNGPYAPHNCVWATHFEQMQNTRRVRHLTHNGKTMLISQWADHLGVSRNTMDFRLSRWGLERALSTHGPRTKSGGLRSVSSSSSS